MPKLSPYVQNLRHTTRDAVETLMQKKLYAYEKDALLYIYTLSRRKRTQTGFNMTSFDKFHQQYRDFKRKK